jgi:hypothetical protein
VQFAIYSILVTLAAAPMATIGGYLPGWLQRLGLHADLRVTFYACIPCMLAALWAARAITEPGSVPARAFLRGLPGHLWRLKAQPA